MTTPPLHGWPKRLVAAGRLTATQAAAAAQGDGWWGERLEPFVDADALARFMAEAAGLPYAEPAPPDGELRRLLDDDFPHVAPLRLDGGTLHVAVREPYDYGLLDRLSAYTGCEIAPAIASWRRIAAAREAPPEPPAPPPPRRWRVFPAADPARTAAEVVFGDDGLEIRSEVAAMRALLAYVIGDPLGVRFDDDRPLRGRAAAVLATLHHAYPAYRAEPVA